MSFMSAKNFVHDLDLSDPDPGSKSDVLYRKTKAILENYAELWEMETLDFWQSFQNRTEACTWLIEYDQRARDLLEKIGALPTETLQGSLENLESIIEALPRFDDYQERQMLLLYSESIRYELYARAKAEADPEYRQEREELLEAQSSQRKAKREAREYLERTKPRAS